MSSSFEIKVPPKRYDGENKWLRFQLLEWLSFAFLVTLVAADMLNDQVLPLYDEQVLEDIEHRRTKA